MSLSTDIKQASFPSPHSEAVLNIHYTSHWLYRLFQQQLAEFEISSEQYNILRILRGNRGAPYNLRDVRERMLNRTDNTTRLVEKLRCSGLVTRTPNEDDRRRVDITITEEGLELLDRMDAPLGDFQARIAEALSDREAKQLSRLLDRLRDRTDLTGLADDEDAD